MSHALSFLLSAEAAAARAASRKPRFVVHIETCGDMSKADRFVELDADDIGHAHDLAHNWVHTFGNTSAAIRRADADGKLHKPCAYI